MARQPSRIGYKFLGSPKTFYMMPAKRVSTHTTFAYELLLYRAIQNGDITGVDNAITLYRNSGLVIGHMSDNPLREIHYWAVSAIAIAIHYAILGGLDESEAYQLSDRYIQEIDLIITMEECLDYLCDKALELTRKVNEDKIPQCYSPLINQCMHWIHIHLHHRLKIADIAAELHVSRDYLSQAFKKETGITLHRYIVDQKLEEAQHMLSQGKSLYEISYTLCFCNESHFIQLFKKKYHVTPAEYLNSAGR